MFNINQKKASNNGFIQKVKNFFFGGSKDKAKYVPVTKSVEPNGLGHAGHFCGHDGQRERRKRINRRRNDIAFDSRRRNWGLA